MQCCAASSSKVHVTERLQKSQHSELSRLGDDGSNTKISSSTLVFPLVLRGDFHKIQDTDGRVRGDSLPLSYRLSVPSPGNDNGRI